MNRLLQYLFQFVSQPWRRLLSLLRRRRHEREMEEEMRFHLEMQIEQNLASGMAAEEAHYAARRQFGNQTWLKEASREMWSLNSIETLIQDLRYGARILLKNPGFTLVAIITLSLGIGANTTIFSLINSLLLKPIPFPQADRLALVWQSQVNNPESRNIVSAPNFWDWQRQNDVFENMAVFDTAGKGYDLSGDGEPERVFGLRVSAGFFDTLGVKPRLGRAFSPEEEQPGKHQVIVISDGLWRSRYNSDPSIVGKTIKVDSENHTVIGVMPPEFEFQFRSPIHQLWVPVAYTRNDQDRGWNSFVCIARLKPGVTMEQAGAQMNTIGLRLAREYPLDNAGGAVAIDPIVGFGMESQKTSLLTLLAVAGFVLLIACVNVANLLMARGAARQRELAIRVALGASRARTIRQLLTESLLLAFAGGLSGILIAAWSSNLLLKILPGDLRAVPFRSINSTGGLAIDYKTLAFSWGVTCLTGIIFGLAPALIFSKRNVNESLHEGSRGTTGGGAGLRQGLVVLEVALALVVLTGAGLMIQSMARLLNVAPGFDPHNVITLNISLPQENTHVGPPAHPQFARDLQEHVGSIPGVVSVSAVSHLPIGGGHARRQFVIEGKPDPGPENQPGAGYSVICPNYFRTMGVRLISGREFTELDSQNVPGVIVINETMARRYWPDEDPLGRRIKLGGFNSDNPWLTIVGVAQDVKHGLDMQSPLEFFRPYSQAAWPQMRVVVRTAANPATFINPIKQALARIEPDRAASGIRTMDEILYDSVGSRRFPMMLLVAFSLLALALASVGISGVVGFSVAQRTREIGVRMALGARKVDVIRLVLNRSMAAALMGVAAGLVASFGLTRFLTGLLFEVKPMDPLILGSSALILASVAFVACYLPARRATNVDPMIALRVD
ncbi:MAG TPA: ABC transporter permease [Blastocatellia bacterium]|nr:ABC transporter permease [Blastocatellia bacterium]